MSNSRALVAIPGSPENAGVVRYMNNARNLGVPGINNLNNRLKSANVSLSNNDDWEFAKLMLVLEPMLSYLIANVYVVGRRKLGKLTGRAPPSMNNPNNRRLANITNTNLAVLNNPNALRNAIKNAASIKNARNVVLIQNAIHTVVFGLITVMGTIEILNSYMSVSKLDVTTQPEEFFFVAYKAIKLISRIVLPLILAIVQKVFKRTRTGTRAVILSSVAAVLAATRIDNRAITILKGTLNNAKNSFMKLHNKAALINQVARIYDPSIANKRLEALGLAITAARDTLRSAMHVLGNVILSALALNKGGNMITAGRKGNTPRSLTYGNNNKTGPVTPRRTNVNNSMRRAANALLSLRNNNRM